MEVQDLINNLPGHKSAAEEKLEQFGKELFEGSHELARAKMTFGKLAEAFLEKFPPAFSEEPEDNLKEYDKLIVLSLRSDNKNLLFKWGIEYPQSKKFSWMSNQPAKRQYVNALAVLRDENYGAEDYYNYLIDCLKSN